MQEINVVSAIKIRRSAKQLLDLLLEHQDDVVHPGGAQARLIAAADMLEASARILRDMAQTK